MVTAQIISVTFVILNAAGMCTVQNLRDNKRHKCYTNLLLFTFLLDLWFLNWFSPATLIILVNYFVNNKLIGCEP
jgi:hypothetical protein